MMKIRNFLKNSKGATAIEYGLIAALIAVVIIPATGALGNKVAAKFQAVATGMDGAAAGGEGE